MVNTLLKELILKIINPEQNFDAAERALISIFGSYENAKKIIKEIIPIINSFTEEDISCLNSLLKLFEDITSFFALIRFAAAPNQIVLTPKVLNVLAIFQSGYKLQPNTLKQSDRNTQIQGVLGEFIHTKKIFSIVDICKDFKVDKATFVKWLHWFFKDRFIGRKKLSFIEYKDIYAAMLLNDKNASFDFSNDVNKYLVQLNSGVVFKKKDLALSAESDLKTLTRNLAHKYPIYPHLDKFPSSMAQVFKQKMG